MKNCIVIINFNRNPVVKISIISSYICRFSTTFLKCSGIVDIYNSFGDNDIKEIIILITLFPRRLIGMVETKRERFIRVAETRTNKIIKLIDLLGNCANRNNYEYTDQDIKMIIGTLENEIKELKNKFNQSSIKEKEFKLKL
jgi:hypothetical protein